MKAPTRFRLEELIKLPTFMLPVTSWKGDQIAYYSDRSGTMELWVVDLTTGDHRQASEGQLPKAIHTGFAWDRAGEAIVVEASCGSTSSQCVLTNRLTTAGCALVIQ